MLQIHWRIELAAERAAFRARKALMRAAWRVAGELRRLSRACDSAGLALPAGSRRRAAWFATATRVLHASCAAARAAERSAQRMRDRWYGLEIRPWLL